MLMTHAIESAVRVDDTPAGLACDAGNLVRLFRGGRYRSGDLIQCGPALTEEAI